MFALLWLPSVNSAFFDVIDSIMRALNVDDVSRYCGQDLYRFWQGTNEYCSAVSS